MAALTIHRGIAATDDPTSVKPDQWPELVEARRDYCRSAMFDDCRLIVQFTADAEPVNWFGYSSRDEYIRDGLGLDASLVEFALAGLRSLGVSAPASLDRATSEGRRLAQHGGDRRSEEARENQPDGCKVEPGYGNSTAYTIARLDRDRPELAEKVKAGEMSANAAAIEAGFRKRQTPLDLLRSAWRRASKPEREAFIAEVTVEPV